MRDVGMPRYDYRCVSCGQVVEVTKTFAAPDPTRHERCGGTLRRVFSAPAVKFRGDGFYSTSK